MKKKNHGVWARTEARSIFRTSEHKKEELKKQEIKPT